MSTSQLTLDRNTSQLLVVDIQERLFQTFNEKVQESLLKNNEILIAAAKQLELPLIVSEQYPKGLGPTVSKLVDAVGETPHLEKVTFSCMGEPTMREAIEKHEGAKTVVMTGIETHVCVYQTALDLINAGYTVHVPEDAVGSRAKSNWQRGLALLERAGAVVTSTETVLFQLLGQAGTPDFKALSPLVR